LELEKLQKNQIKEDFKMKKRLIWILVVSMCLILFAGCSTTKESQKTTTEEPQEKTTEVTKSEKLTIGLALNDISSVWVKYVAEAAQEFADENGINLVLSDAALNAAKQVEDVENWITMKFDAILVKPVDSDVNKVMCEEVRATGIPYISLEDVLDEADAFIAQDNIGTGELLTETVLKTINYKGKVAIIYGAPGAKVCDERLQGCLNIIEKYPDVELVAQEPGNWLRADAMTITETWLQAGILNDVDAIIANCDEMAIGAYLALEDAGVADKYFIGSIDGTDEGLKYIKEGKVGMTLYASAYDMGYGSMEMAKEIIEKGSTEDRVLALEVITKDNVDEYIKQ
jgi:inositol transport system substrate-binding protein